MRQQSACQVQGEAPFIGCQLPDDPPVVVLHPGWCGRCRRSTLLQQCMHLLRPAAALLASEPGLQGLRRSSIVLSKPVEAFEQGLALDAVLVLQPSIKKELLTATSKTAT